MTTIERIKWASTFCVLGGILLTNLNIYPLNIALHGTGCDWLDGGGVFGKRPRILTNFGLQLPLFTLGISKVTFGF